MIINDLDGYYIVFDTKNWNTELDTLPKWATCRKIWIVQTGGSYNAEYALLFNNFYSNIAVSLTSSLWICISVMP